MPRTSQPSCKVTMRSGTVHIAKGSRQEIAELLWPSQPPENGAHRTMSRDLHLTDDSVVTINAGFVEGVEDS